MVPICCARLLSDLSAQTVCDKEATSADGRLCAFHALQCDAKRRFSFLESGVDAPVVDISSVS